MTLPLFDAHVAGDQTANESSPLFRTCVCSMRELLVPQAKLMPSAYRLRKRELRTVRPVVLLPVQTPNFLCSTQTCSITLPDMPSPVNAVSGEVSSRWVV